MARTLWRKLDALAEGPRVKFAVQLFIDKGFSLPPTPPQRGGELSWFPSFRRRGSGGGCCKELCGTAHSPLLPMPESLHGKPPRAWNRPARPPTPQTDGGPTRASNPQAVDPTKSAQAPTLSG